VIERDYIMRMINLLAQFLTRVLLHRSAREFPQARRELEAAYKSLLGMSPGLAREFSDEQLIGMFGRDQDTVVLKSYILGSLIRQEGEILVTEGKDASREFLHSLSLLLTAFLLAGNEAQEGHSSAIEEVVGHLCNVEIPPHIREKLLTYYDRRGRYDKAEDVLFELVESDPGWVDNGIKFYERLLSRPDAELEGGGLPRSEVVEGMSELRRMS